MGLRPRETGPPFSFGEGTRGELWRKEEREEERRRKRARLLVESVGRGWLKRRGRRYFESGLREEVRATRCCHDDAQRDECALGEPDESKVNL